MNIIELYEKDYEKYKSLDSIPVILNVNKKTYNYLRYIGIYDKKEKINISIDKILVDNTANIDIKEEETC